jgi:hypothetical protein
MHNRLLSFLKKHNILTSEQHGFMESKSTETASHLFIQNIQEALDKHLYVTDIFLDISKAYDVINHNRLLDKLGSYGIRGLVNKWFQSYLTVRTQFVEISQIEVNTPNTAFNPYRKRLHMAYHRAQFWGPFHF